MKARLLAMAVLGIGMVSFCAVPVRAQASITFSFGDQDRQGMRDWYRDHSNAPEFQDRRWNDQSEQRLVAGTILAPNMRGWARPAPQDLYRRLAPLQRNFRYVIVGDHVLAVDGRWMIYDVYHFERFDNADQQAMHDWYAGQRDNGQFDGPQRGNDQNGQRIRIGYALDPNLRQLARPAPTDLVNRLPARPRYLRYVIVGDQICLIDNQWTVRDVLDFDRQGNAENVTRDNNDPRDNNGNRNFDANRDNGANRSLRIVRAEYGYGNRMVDVSNRLNTLMQGGKLDFQVTNQTMGGDPFPGQKKELKLTYAYGDRTEQATIAEGNRLNLPGSQGQGRPY